MSTQKRGARSATSESTGSLGDYTATLEQVYVWMPNVIICNGVDAKP